MRPDELALPFFDDAHRDLAERARVFALAHLAHAPHATHATVDDTCRATGCGAMTSMRSATASPGVSAGSTKAEMPRAPLPSLVRAKSV